ADRVAAELAELGGGHGAYRPLTPARILDTREALGLASSLGPNRSADLQVNGRGGVPDTGVGAVVLNLTATNPTSSSYVTAWHAGGTRPVASNLNVVAGQTVPNLVIVPVGANGRVSLYNQQGTVDLVADVQGWFPSGSSGYTGAAPFRILDTREGLGVPTALGQGQSVELQVAGAGAVPATGATAVVLNVTATEGTLPSYITVWPTGATRPVASNLNTVRGGHTVANAVIVPLGTNGKISLFNFAGTTDLIADVQGWFTGDSGLADAESWKIVPASVLLDANETRQVTLLGVRADGTTFVPHFSEAPTIKTAGSGVSITYVSDGTLRVTAGAAAATVFAAVQPPGSATSAAMTASIVRLAPGVTVLDDNIVQFPVPYAATGEEQIVALAEDYTTQGIFGFTKAEVGARIHVDTESEPADEFLAPDARFPLIVTGAPPATNSLIITAGGTGVTGRVVEPPGLPTIQRGGYSLVSVEMVNIEMLYDDLEYTITGEQLSDLGFDWYDIEEYVPDDDAASTAEGGAGAEAPTARAESSWSRLADDDTEPPATPEKPKCAFSEGAATVTVDPLVPSITLGADVDFSREREHYKFVPSLTGTIKAGFSVSMQASVGATCEFDLGPHGEITMRLPGLLAGILNGFAENSVVAKAAISLKFGPTVGFTVRCTSGFTVRAGFEMTRGNVQLRGGFEPIFQCPDTKATFPANSFTDGAFPLSLSISGGKFLRIEVGGRVGGDISRALGYLFSNPELGKAGIVKVDVGPNLTYVQENRPNAMQAKKSSSKLALQLKGTASVTAKGVGWLVKAFGGRAGAVGITLWDQQIDLLTAFAAPAITGMQYQINDEGYKTLAEGETIYAEQGDVVKVRTTL
ncbi:MAG TPA: hypothetical protein PLV68_16665, partial [Ilumatobacteraceae bacterium]|nr:hypothetical protein [Ilumatobacteraceae bacterium]